MKFGKVERIAPRHLWPDEAKDFTPWLASKEGLALLAEKIKLDELELIETEASVGPFSADIVCKIPGEEERIVVIENQFGKTNHDHLGKLITYASGKQAKILVWITETFTEQHRQALDWLNENSAGDMYFFGLEVFGEKIGESLPAPVFEVKSSPNEWAHAVRDSKQSEASSTKLDQQQFWEEIREYLKAKKSRLQLRQPRPQHWYEISVGKSGFHLSLTVNTQVDRAGCELYMYGPQAKQAFDMLVNDKEAIEKELALKPEWQRLEGKEACRIVTYKDGSIYNPDQRKELMEWLHSMTEIFHKVFAPKVKALKLSSEAENE